MEPEDRMNAKWEYVLLGEKLFYGFSDRGGGVRDIMEYARLTRAKVEGTLSDYLVK
jgi:type III restriction enzyme